MALLRSALLGHNTVEVQNDIVSDDSMVCEAQLGYDGLPAKDAKAIQDDFRYYNVYCFQLLQPCGKHNSIFLQNEQPARTFDTLLNAMFCLDHASMRLHTVTL